MSKAFVYMAVTEGGGERLIKIGRTWNLRLRMMSLSRKQPLRLAAYIECPDDWSAHQREMRLHAQAQASAGGTVGREWHRFSPAPYQHFMREEGVRVCL